MTVLFGFPEPEPAFRPKSYATQSVESIEAAEKKQRDREWLVAWDAMVSIRRLHDTLSPEWFRLKPLVAPKGSGLVTPLLVEVGL